MRPPLGSKENPHRLPAEVAREPRWKSQWDRRPPGAAKKAQREADRGKPLMTRLGEALARKIAEKGGL